MEHGTDAPREPVSAADLARLCATYQVAPGGPLERAIAQILKDRIDLRDALEACVDTLAQAFDFAGNSFGDPECHAIREARRVLRRTA